MWFLIGYIWIWVVVFLGRYNYWKVVGCWCEGIKDVKFLVRVGEFCLEIFYFKSFSFLLGNWMALVFRAFRKGRCC